MIAQPLQNLASPALPEPQICDGLQLPSGELGINFAAALGNYPEHGMKVWIAPWPGKALGDKVELLLNNRMIDQQVISEAVEVTERTTLWVPPRAVQSGSHTLAYRLTRRDQMVETFAAPLQLLVKLDIPGGDNLDPLHGQHSALYMDIAGEILRDGVTTDNVGDGVDITITARPDTDTLLPYPNMAEGDVCTLSWGGLLIFSEAVTQAHIDDPLENPLVIHVSRETILKARDTGPEGLQVSFSVADQVGNVSAGGCPPARVKVRLGKSPLPAPIISKTSGSDLHLDSLRGEDLVVQIWAESINDFCHRDVIILHFAGVSAEGESICSQNRQIIVGTPPTVVFARVPSATARALANTQVTCFYSLERNGMIIQSSLRRFINVVGETEHLASPIVEDEEEGTLDPALAGIEVNIPFNKTARAGHVFALDWLGVRADLSTYNPELDGYRPSAEEVRDRQGFFIPVAGKHLKTLAGGTLLLSYKQLRIEDDEVVSRRSLDAQLLKVGELVQHLDADEACFLGSGI